MGDLISQVVQLTQLRLAQRLAFSEEMQSMVLEVRADSLRVIRLLSKILSFRPLKKKAEDLPVHYHVAVSDKDWELPNSRI